MNTTQPVYVECKTCRSCDEPLLRPVLSLGDQYLPDFVAKRDYSMPQAPLNLMRCDHCGLLQLQHMTDMELLCREYHYRSGINQTMRDALADVVLDGNQFSKEGVWLDIGANDGYLLSRVGERFTKIASEPALNLLSLLEEHADHVIPDFFKAGPFLEQAQYADVITTCACFYHVNDPDRFVSDIALCLAPDGVWINQLNDAPTMLKRNAFDAICHEHACYYTVHDLNRLYKRHGLHIVSIKYNSVNGGSVRVAAKKHKVLAYGALNGVEDTTAEHIDAFVDRVTRWKTQMQEILDMPSFRSGELWAIGASTKGAVSMQYLDMNDRFTGIADRNPAKHGKFATGSWLPVMSEEAMRLAKPKVAVNLIWAFRDELVLREAELRRSGTSLLNILPHIEFVS